MQWEAVRNLSQALLGNNAPTEAHWGDDGDDVGDEEY
jgi:hypothetical protein